MVFLKNSLKWVVLLIYCVNLSKSSDGIKLQIYQQKLKSALLVSSYYVLIYKLFKQKLILMLNTNINLRYKLTWKKLNLLY